MCGIFLLSLCVMLVLTGFVVLPLFSMSHGGTGVSSNFSTVYTMLLNIVPDNLFTPFTQGNTLQIPFIGIITGIMLLIFGEKTRSTANLIEQLQIIVNGIMLFINRLLPLFIFGNIFNMVISSNVNSFAPGGKFFLSSTVGLAALIIFHTLLVWLRTRIPPLTLWKKCFSTFLIALTTGSSSAAFQDNVNTCTEKFGISKKCAYFGVSFGQVFYNTGISIMLWCGAVVAAERCGIDFSPTWITTAMILIFGLALAAPPVAGGGAASFSILFAQLGLPLSDLAVILALYNILDFLNTAVKVFGIQCVVLAADFRNDQRD